MNTSTQLSGITSGLKVPNKGSGIYIPGSLDRHIYDKAVHSLKALLEGKAQLSDVLIGEIETLEEMFNHCLSHDSEDWFTVYSEFGAPRIRHLRRISDELSHLRPSLTGKDEDRATDVVARIADANIYGPLWSYANRANWLNHLPEGAGWVYILYQDCPDILKIGMTKRSRVRERVLELNRYTVVLYPFSIRMAFPVKDAKASEAVIFERLDSYRLRPDREFFQVAPWHAIREAEQVFNQLDMFSRPTGIIASLNRRKRSGVIKTSEGELELSEVPANDIQLLEKGVDVEFDVGLRNRQPVAMNVRTLKLLPDLLPL